LELVQSTLKQDLLSKHFFTIQVNLTVVNLWWLGLLRAGFASFPDLWLQAGLHNLDQLNFFADVIPGLLHGERFHYLSIRILQLPEASPRALPSRPIGMLTQDLQYVQIILLVAHRHVLSHDASNPILLQYATTSCGICLGLNDFWHLVVLVEHVASLL